MTSPAVLIDVREDLRQGREPFSRIMSTVAELTEGQELVLIAPFEPVPLFSVMARKGFGYEARKIDMGAWEVRFSRNRLPKESNPLTDSSPSVAASAVIDLDACGLEPPQPMVKILEALAGLPSGGQLRARTDRRPMHLYAQLEARGFTGETEEQPDGSFITHIRHTAA